MQALTLRQRSLVGLTLFAMFFGAGNLIFPPWLGVQAGTESLSAFIGFLITAVGFPILGVMAVAESGGLKNLGARVHPVFAFIFMFLIYLSLGPCLAIPRTARTSFELVVRPLLAENGLLEAPLLGWTALGFSQLAYSVLFFLAGERAEEVAAYLGYAAPSAFSSAFRRVFGTSPSTFRNVELSLRKIHRPNTQ